MSKAGHRSPCVPAFPSNSRQLEDVSTHRSTFVDYVAFPINSVLLDVSVFTSTLPATKRRSRTCATRATDGFFRTQALFSKT